MTPADYRAALAALGINQTQAAKLLGVDARTSRRWALGEREVPPPVANFLRHLIQTKASVPELLAGRA